MPTESLTIDRRVEISLALARYLRSVERFEAASAELNEACQGVRKSLPQNSRYIANINHRHYLVTCDDAGNFNAEEMDTL